MIFQHNYSSQHIRTWLLFLIFYRFTVVFCHVKALVNVAWYGLYFSSQLLLNTFQVESIIIGDQVDGQAKMSKATSKKKFKLSNRRPIEKPADSAGVVNIAFWLEKSTWTLASFTLPSGKDFLLHSKSLPLLQCGTSSKQSSILHCHSQGCIWQLSRHQKHTLEHMQNNKQTHYA